MTERPMAFPSGRRKPISSTPLPRASLGAPALRANSGRGDSTWVASGFCATSTNVVFPHFAQVNCTRGRPTSCASGRECCAPQLEQAAFISPHDSGPNLPRLLPAKMWRHPMSYGAGTAPSCGYCGEGGHWADVILSLCQRRRHTPFCRMFKRICEFQETRFAARGTRETHGER